MAPTATIAMSDASIAYSRRSCAESAPSCRRKSLTRCNNVFSVTSTSIWASREQAPAPARGKPWQTSDSARSNTSGARRHLDLGSDVAENGVDGAAGRRHGTHRNQRNQRYEQRLLEQILCFVTTLERIDKLKKPDHRTLLEVLKCDRGALMIGHFRRAQQSATSPLEATGVPEGMPSKAMTSKR